MCQSLLETCTASRLDTESAAAQELADDATEGGPSHPGFEVAIHA
jgi:hypothetical protein